MRDAMRYSCFEYVGTRIGMTIEVLLTDGRQPMAGACGPALETRDVIPGALNDPDAPAFTY